MNVKKTCIVFLIALTAFQLTAQQKWSLEECVAYALEHNLQLNDFEYTAQANKETYRQSVRNLLPDINASTGYAINFGRSTDPFTNDVVTTEFFSNGYNLDASIDLFQGFQKLNSIKASKFLKEATREEALQQRYLLAFRVMQAFYDIQFSEGLVTISEEQVAISQTNYDLVKRQIELGLMAGADLYEAESLLLTDQLALTQIQNQLATAKLQLIQEMNLENENDISILYNMGETDFFKDATKIRTDSIYAVSEGFLPLIKGQELRAKAAQKQLAVERGRLYPSLAMFWGVGTGYFETTRDTLGNTIPFRDQFRDNTFQNVGLSLRIPISNRWAQRSRVKQGKIEKLRAQNNLDIQRQVLFQTIQQLVQEYNSLRVEQEQSVQNVEAQNLAFTIAQRRYERGLINALELSTAKNLFANAQNVDLQVRLRLEVNKSTLDFYRGLPVFDVDAP
ncbi:MAG: TolC family protein [Bacteroidota bacterium]